MQTRASREWKQRRDAERASRAERIGSQRPPATLHAATVGGSTRGAAPKSRPYRDATLLAMAEGRPCLLCPPGACTCTPGSVVACHSNLGIHAKGGARKADDVFSVWGGMEAHRRLDQPIGHGGPSKAEKEAKFMAAHALQVMAWRVVATDPAEPERFRRAARRALEYLNATPLPEETA